MITQLYYMKMDKIHNLFSYHYHQVSTYYNSINLIILNCLIVVFVVGASLCFRVCRWLLSLERVITMPELIRFSGSIFKSKLYKCLDDWTWFLIFRVPFTTLGMSECLYIPKYMWFTCKIDIFILSFYS